MEYNIDNLDSICWSWKLYNWLRISIQLQYWKPGGETVLVNFNVEGAIS